MSAGMQNQCQSEEDDYYSCSLSREEAQIETDRPMHSQNQSYMHECTKLPAITFMNNANNSDTFSRGLKLNKGFTQFLKDKLKLNRHRTNKNLDAFTGPNANLKQKRQYQSRRDHRHDYITSHTKHNHTLFSESQISLQSSERQLNYSGQKRAAIFQRTKTMKEEMDFMFLKNYKNYFGEMLQSDTKQLVNENIISIDISKDSKYIIVISEKKNIDKQNTGMILRLVSYYVSMYDALDLSLQFSELISRNHQDNFHSSPLKKTLDSSLSIQSPLSAQSFYDQVEYIKIKEVIQGPQNSEGNQTFVIVFFDNGCFKMRIFSLSDSGCRSQQEIYENEVNLNDELNLDHKTMVIDQLNEPFISCIFLSKNKLFISLYYNYTYHPSQPIDQYFTNTDYIPVSRDQYPQHYHFEWLIKQRKLIGKQSNRPWQREHDLPIRHQFDHIYKLNFPLKTMVCSHKVKKNRSFATAEYKKLFTSSYEHTNKIFVFYRHGQMFTIEEQNPEIYQVHNIVDTNIDNLLMIDEDVLVVQSSSKILFFKHDVTHKHDNLENHWLKYHQLQMHGLIQHSKEKRQLLVITDKLIYFYKIDRKTLLPAFENVMFNYLNCTRMIFGKDNSFCVSFKNKDKCFQIHRRKQQHDTIINVNNQDFQGSLGVEVTTMGCFLVSKTNTIQVFDLDSFEYLYTLKVEATDQLESDFEKSHILGLSLSNCEQYLAVILGKQYGQNDRLIQSLIIFQQFCHQDQVLSWVQKYNLNLLALDLEEQFDGIFQEICMQFYFQENDSKTIDDSLIFATKSQIFKFNFITKQLTILYTFKITLDDMPIYFCLGPNQQILQLASKNDGVWINLTEKKEYDLDELLEIGQIRGIFYDQEDEKFYIVANKYKNQLGFYLTSYKCEDPEDYIKIMTINNKLNIEDVCLKVIRGNNPYSDKPFKELVIGYKIIYFNIFQVTIQDLSIEQQIASTFVRHESFHLWECQIFGLISSKNKDLITLSKDGIKLLTLCPEDNRQVQDYKNQQSIIHSIASYSYLQLETSNLVNYRFQDDKNKVISIEQEFEKQIANNESETAFEQIYSIKIDKPSFHELLTMQSLYLCKQIDSIIQLVQMQPNPSLFYKSFFELGSSNLTTILSFNSHNIAFLLDEKHSGLFDIQFPIIYKAKIFKTNKLRSEQQSKKYIYASAIDIAIKHEQAAGLIEMLNYVTNFQNNYFSSYLFSKNMPSLIQMGIPLTRLFSSDIFRVKIDFDSWDSSHTNPKKDIRPYHDSIFTLRYNYNKVFPEYSDSADKNDIFQQNRQKEKKQKLFKISYSINLLPSIGEYIQMIDDKQNGEELKQLIINENLSFQSLLSDTEELSIFQTKIIQEIINYQWDEYGRRFHYIPFFFHMYYVIVINMFVVEIYLLNHKIHKNILVVLLLPGIIYPIFHESCQLKNEGCNYFSQGWNYIDILYILFSTLNFMLQIELGPLHIATKLIFILVIVFVTFKTFFFMRIFRGFTPIVVLLGQVIMNLKAFIFTFSLQLLMLSQLFAVLQVGIKKPVSQNTTKTDNKLRILASETNSTNATSSTPYYNKKEVLDIPDNEDFKFTGMWLGEFLWTIRVSLGDFSIVGAIPQKQAQSYLFWIGFFIVVFSSNIILLNFIVAEASNSYQKVVKKLDQIVWKGWSDLISEADSMTWKQFKTNKKFPKYLITRENTD